MPTGAFGNSPDDNYALTAIIVESSQSSEFSAPTILRGTDYGDLPDASYLTLRSSNGARHGIRNGVFLGAGVDADSDGQPNAAADGDDNDVATNDEDGVTIPATLSVGGTSNLTVVASVAGFLSGWIDYNADGDFLDAGEQIFNDQAVTAGSNSLSVTLAQTVTTGNSYARFRFSDRSGQANSPSGFTNGGEVEDYLVVIASQADLEVSKTDSSTTYTPGGTGSYTISVTNNGPSNVSGVAIADSLPAGVILSAAWTCSATASSSCSAASGGSAGDTVVNLTADIISGGTVTITVPVAYSADPSAY